MYLNNVKYILSAPSKKYWLDNKKKEICVVGRSNVGKSTFINMLTNNKNMAKVSSTPGYTKYLNFFDVNNSFYLVDSPGYGFAKASWTRDESFANMMHEYLFERDNLICVILIVDSKIGFTKDDLALLDMIHQAKRQVQIFGSKVDKTNQSLRSAFFRKANEVLTEDEYNNIILYSSLDKNAPNELVERVLKIYNS